MGFKLTTVKLGNEAFSIEVDGEADLATAPELKQALAEVIDSGARVVLVDFSASSFIDSTALGVLMGAMRRLRPVHGEVAIVCNDPNIRKMFELTLLDRIFNIFETSEAGLAHLEARASQAANSA
jgi:anti-sigma B factor antagonist